MSQRAEQLGSEPATVGSPDQDAPRRWSSRAGSLVRRLRQRLAHRPDTEHEQALIRIGFAVFIAAYVVFLPAELPDREAVVEGCFAIAGACFVAAVLVFVHIVLRPEIVPARRIAGMLIDTIGLNGVMYVGGLSTALFYPILLWVILGHGFRFGRLYLFAAASTSLVLFAGVVTRHPEWREVPSLDVALALALVILPAYFAVLLGKLQDAIARAEEASRVKSHFLAMMSHEFRTPLNAIIGINDLLVETRLDHEQRGMAATIRSAARTLLALVNDILDLAKLETRRFTIDLEPLDLHARLATVRSMLRQQAAEKGLRLSLRLDPMTPWHVKGGAQLLHQILVNLVANAIKFTETGGVRIEVRPIDVTDDEARIRFEVHDTGIGIAPERQGAVFERFTQAEEETRRVFGGTGLGLSIAKELVELMGGRIGLISTPGVGSTFWFELAFQTLPAPESEARFMGTVILLDPGAGTDDELLPRIERLGPRVVITGSIPAAVEQVRYSGGRHVVLVRGPVDELVPGLVERLHEEMQGEAVDVLTLASGDREYSDMTLADLPSDPPEAVLRTALRAAFAGSPSSGTRDNSTALRRARQPARILLAEDNRTNQKVLGTILERAGHQVTIVGNGQDAVERIERESYDLVLMDIGMPGMSGIEAVKLLRFLKDPHELPPLVALSADATSETRELCSRIGFTDYLTKPIDAATLLSQVEKLVSAHGAFSRASAGAAPASSPSPTAPPSRPAVRWDERERESSGGTVSSPQPVGRAPSGTGEIIDRERLESLRRLDDNAGFLTELIDDFLEDGRAIVEHLAEAVSRGDAKVFRDQAHALRSSAAHIGAKAIFELSLTWRQLDDGALLMRGPHEIAALREELVRLEQALRAFQRETSPR